MKDIDRRRYLVIASTPSHRRKVETAKRIISEAASVGRLVVSTSWGKDSVALCDLAIDALGPVPLFHLASPYGLPGYEDVVAHFSVRTDVHVLEATRTLAEYVDWCHAIGLPHERSRSAQSQAVGEIKRDRGTAWCLEQGYAVQALGLRIAEKGPRAALLRSRGPTYALAVGLTKSNPIAYWSTADVWAYLVSRGLPYNRAIYDAETHGLTRETIRNTGWLSTDGAAQGRIAWLRTHFPDQYRILVREFPRVSMLV